MKRVLAFDIGIKNLAWCCGDLSGSTVYVKGWANENLLSGGTAESDTANNKCELCKNKAGYWLASTKKGYCVRHCPPLTPALRDLSGNVLKKIPAVNVLKELAKRMDAEKADLKTKVSLIAFLETRLCFPKPPTIVKKIDLEALHDGMRKFILQNRALFTSCTEILLENQPVLKNPVMKSVQMMLFATLRDLCREGSVVPKVRLVHAGRKTAGVIIEKGDEGYSERKGASESRVLEGLRDGSIQTENKSWFSSQTKKSDLADCLCMVLDCA
jgi:hypothetical protein